MPLGNGPARGLPSPPLGVLADPRQYDTDSVGSYDSSFSIIQGQGTSPYARVIAATPGLVHWWRMGALKAKTFQGGNLVVLPAAGPSCLMPSGTVTVVTGLLPGDTDKACYLNGAYLHANDYFLQVGTHEVFSLECWVKLVAMPIDSALMGEWVGNTGNMIFVQSDGTIKMFQTSSHADSASGTITTGKTYHVVACYGGTDHVSRLYVNTVQVASGNLTNGATTAASWGSTVQFEAGQYAGHAGSSNLNGVLDELAIYSRMLQPAEVKQHYAAAFARGGA